MVQGDPFCLVCRENPTHRLSCGCGCCYQHSTSHPADSVGVCPTCNKQYDFIVPVPPSTPRLEPADAAWTPVHSAVSLPGPSVAMDFSGRGHGANGSGQPRIREQNNKTPTPSGPMNNLSASVGAGGRYVPPQMRGQQEPPVRPESSMSNNTFLSQLNEGHQANDLRTMLVERTPRGMMSGQTGFTPRGHFSYAPPQLSADSASADPFVDVTSAPRDGTFYANGQHGPLHSQQGTANAYRSPPTLNPFAGSISLPCTVQRPSFTSSTSALNDYNASFAPSSVATPAPSFVPSHAGSGHDSAAANGFGVNLSQAVNLARLIRSGATDNPMDPDYGNPGRSKRLPPEPSNQINPTPQPRGKVVASDSQSLTVYDSEANTKGNVAAYLGTANVELPQWFYKLNSGFKPSLEDVYSALPVVEACRIAKPSSAGVVKITNIPYACDRKEIVAFLGRAAQINNMPEGSPYHAVHVMIDRGTGKTLDAYVELKHAKEAMLVSKQFEARLQAGRHAKIGDREVKVALISQGELMADLFPYGKNLVWDHNGVPVISQERPEYFPGYPSMGFNGFLTNEELVHMSKFAETPQRSPFMQRCLMRGYEHLISVIHKFPWFAIDHVLISERNHLFDTTVRNVRALMGLLRKTQHQPRRDSTLPTINTLQELVVAALTCPGFSEGQKFTIIRNLDEGGYGNLTQPRGMNFRFGGNSRYSPDWPFLALVKQPGVPDDMVEYVASLMREATDDTANLSLADLHAMRASNMRPALFGRLLIDTAGVTTMAELGRAELRAIEDVLGRVLQRERDSLGSRLSSLTF